MTENDVTQQSAEVGDPAPASPALGKNDEQTWAVIAHLSSMVNLFGIPSPLGPLVVWLVKRDESMFVAEQARASLNFALSVWIYGAAFLILGILSFFSIIGIGLGILCFVLFGLLILVSFVFSIIGAVKASSGEDYDYPFNIELVK